MSKGNQKQSWRIIVGLRRTENPNSLPTKFANRYHKALTMKKEINQYTSGGICCLVEIDYHTKFNQIPRRPNNAPLAELKQNYSMTEFEHSISSKYIQEVTAITNNKKKKTPLKGRENRGISRTTNTVSPQSKEKKVFAYHFGKLRHKMKRVVPCRSNQGICAMTDDEIHGCLSEFGKDSTLYKETKRWILMPIDNLAINHIMGDTEAPLKEWDIRIGNKSHLMSFDEDGKTGKRLPQV